MSSKSLCPKCKHRTPIEWGWKKFYCEPRDKVMMLYQKECSDFKPEGNNE